MNSLDKYINTILSLLEGAKKREIDLYGLNIVVRHYQDHTPVPLSNNGNPSMLQLNTKAKQQYGISTLLMYEHIMEVKKDILPALMSIENPTYENVKETIDDLTRIVIKLKNEEGKLKGRNAEKLLVD
jgi:hypothetical protein